jgi:hypothetical protein
MNTTSCRRTLARRPPSTKPLCLCLALLICLSLCGAPRPRPRRRARRIVDDDLKEMYRPELDAFTGLSTKCNSEVNRR